ncbi:MAG: NAD(P)-binding protein [Nostoc sp.]
MDTLIIFFLIPLFPPPTARYAPENWVSDRPGIDHNVTIVGGSGSGSVFAFALRRAGIGRVTVIDAAEDESLAGVWLTRARMKKLRTPKGSTFVRTTIGESLPVLRVRGYPGATTIHNCLMQLAGSKLGAFAK